jgi:hypothetical protein
MESLIALTTFLELTNICRISQSQIDTFKLSIPGEHHSARVTQVVRYSLIDPMEILPISVSYLPETDGMKHGKRNLGINRLATSQRFSHLKQHLTPNTAGS